MKSSVVIDSFTDERNVERREDRSPAKREDVDAEDLSKEKYLLRWRNHRYRSDLSAMFAEVRFDQRGRITVVINDIITFGQIHLERADRIPLHR